MHAARMVRYRAKLPSLACSLAQSSAGVAIGMPDEGWPQEIVTHHGSPLPAVDDLLAGGATVMPRDDASPAGPLRRPMTVKSLPIATPHRTLVRAYPRHA
jgi:hypothetical protein